MWLPVLQSSKGPKVFPMSGVPRWSQWWPPGWHALLHVYSSWFQAPVIFDPSEEPKPKTKKKKQRKDTTPSTPQRELYYRRGEYLAVKTEDGQSLVMVKGSRPVLEGFVVTMHEGACETGSQIPRALARGIWRTVRTSLSALWQQTPTDRS